MYLQRRHSFKVITQPPCAVWVSLIPSWDEPSDLERLSREELIELVLRLQRPDKTSRTSSKPPATDRKEQRDAVQARRRQARSRGHIAASISDDPDAVVEHRPEAMRVLWWRPAWGPCAPRLSASSERIELPAVAPVVTQHRRLAVRCPSCGDAGRRTGAGGGAAARPFGPRLHAVATYLKTFQALSYERLQAALSDLFGLTLSQGGLMNLLRRAQELLPSWSRRSHRDSAQG